MAKPAELPTDLVVETATGAGAELYQDVLALPVLKDPYPTVLGLARIAAERVAWPQRQRAIGPAVSASSGRRSAQVDVRADAVTVRIRPMRTTDLDALMPFEQDMFGTESWSRQSYADELSDMDTRYYVVAEEDGAVLGSGGLMTIAETAQVMTVGVLPRLVVGASASC